MQNIIRITLALALLPLTASPSRASANLINHPVISELQTASSTNASQEFVELYNPSGSAVSVSDWTVEYKAAASVSTEASWTKKASLSGLIPAYGFYLIATKSYLDSADADWSPTLAARGGTVRLKAASGLVVDQLGYGETANGAEGLPASSPVTGGSIERLPGHTQPRAGNGIDTGDNGSDFTIRTEAEPQSSTSPLENPDETPSEQGEEPSEQPVPPSSLAAITISEALVDPISPLHDSDDEFIELYNPNAEPMQLKDYRLRCGSSFHDYYQLPSLLIPSMGYVVLYARQTGLGLTNGGGTVQLLDPDSNVIDQTPPYPAAPAGQAWAAFDGGWQWTLQLTPGQPNVLAVLPSVAVSAAAKAKATAAKVSVKAAAKTKKAAVPKMAKPKPPKKAKAAPANLAAIPVAESRSLQPATWLIISLAVLTIGYALYEFRYDLHHLYHKLRRNHSARTDDRRPAERRGRD
ncbi:MAG TPA: lamin tail domain-containing protein [Candidatus Polarisedimenticolaceae bacterium]|nr:lamin tail domain-containing protein [Candidatus Polarisedimenticolaceae bacterium]